MFKITHKLAFIVKLVWNGLKIRLESSGNTRPAAASLFLFGADFADAAVRGHTLPIPEIPLVRSRTDTTTTYFTMADKRPAEDDKNGHEGNGANGDGPDVKKAKPVSFNGIL